MATMRHFESSKHSLFYIGALSTMSELMFCLIKAQKYIVLNQIVIGGIIEDFAVFAKA